VVEDHNDFKQEVRSKLDELHMLVLQQGQPTPQLQEFPRTIESSSSPPIMTSRVNTTPIPDTVPAVVSDSSSIRDLQSQMMLLMTESFSKLSTAFVEGKSKSKTEWPKFHGDPKKFGHGILVL
jgi:hypothetical protein